MTEPYVGEIRMFAGTFAPAGFERCNGQLLSISQYEALWSLLGTIYGGDGVGTFGLPNLNARLPIHAGTNPQTGTTFVRGQLGGAESVSLHAGHLPPHTHGVRAASGAATSDVPDTHVPARSAHTPYSSGAPNVTMHPGSLTMTGLGLPHENRAPYLGLTFIIATDGIYPSQP